MDLTLSSFRKLRALLGVLVAAALSTSCSPTYVIRGAIAEAKILHRRRPISAVLADPSTDAETRRKLQLVVQARTFARDQLGLAANESYTTYSWVDSDTLLMVVSAARKDKFVAHYWWFPIVGRVPYKGYFNFRKAYDEAQDLEAKGFDTNVRPSGAFSTLGWFNDPLLNTILKYGDVGLAETVVHEITHNSIYLPGQAGFNESFANFVGDRGAAMFFCTREGAQDARCQTALAAWQDNLVFGAALSDLVRRLEAIYNRPNLTFAEKVTQRDTVFRNWKADYKGKVVPQLKTGFRRYADEPLNNARLIGTRLYYERLDLFEQVFVRYNGDLHAAAQAIIAAAKRKPDSPFAAVEKLLQ